MSSKTQRGQPRRPRGYVRDSTATIAEKRLRQTAFADALQGEIDGLDEDEDAIQDVIDRRAEESITLQMEGDGQGLDYRLPPPPWSDYDRESMHTNLARLRVDPQSSNQVAIFEPAIVRTIANVEGDDGDTFFDIGQYFGELLSKWDHETAEPIFKDVLRMRKAADEPPHRNFLAYRAYCDCLLEFGFDPSMPRLTAFIKETPCKYPVGIDKPAGHKEWWQMYLEAGLVRLAE